MKKRYVIGIPAGAIAAFIIADTAFGGFFGDTVLSMLGIDFGEMAQAYQERQAEIQAGLESAGDTSLEAGDTSLEAGDDAVLEAGDDAVLEAGDDTVLEAGDDAVLEAGDDAVLEAGDDTVLEAGDDAVLEAGDDAVLEAGDDAVLEAGDDAVLEAGDDAVDTGFQGGLYEVQSGDTLSEIVLGDQYVDLTAAERLALAERIVELNPEAFKDGNPHFMYGGSELTLPPEADIKGATASPEFVEKWGDASLYPGAQASSGAERLAPIEDVREISSRSEFTAASEAAAVATELPIPELSGVLIPAEGLPYGDTVIADLMTSPNGDALLTGFDIDLRGGLITEVNGEHVIEFLNQDGSTQKVLLSDADPELIRSAEANTVTLREIAAEINAEALREGEPVTGSRIRQRLIEMTAFEEAVRLTSRDASEVAGQALLEQHQPLSKGIEIRALNPR